MRWYPFAAQLISVIGLTWCVLSSFTPEGFSVTHGTFFFVIGISGQIVAIEQKLNKE